MHAFYKTQHFLCAAPNVYTVIIIIK